MEATPARVDRTAPMGFWRCWSMSAGVMIGSGVFLLPAVLAPYGSISFAGWLLTSLGAIVIALTLGRLANRTKESGGFYIFVRNAFGPLPGFLAGWSYWVSIVFAIAAIAVAFAGYLGALAPGVAGVPVVQACIAALAIFVVLFVNVRGVGAASAMQLITTILKIVPLLMVIGLGAVTGDISNIPDVNPKGAPLIQGLATTALLTMWAFIGIESGVVAAEDVRDAQKTIPRAIIAATISVAALYILATAAVMVLVPADKLAVSEAPFALAAAGFGPWGGPLIAIGALVSTFGSLNGNVFLGGQMAMAAARNGTAPAGLAKRNAGGAPARALIFSSGLAVGLLVLNYAGGLVAAFTFLISMSTLATLLPYALSALAEIKHSARRAAPWAIIAIVALVYAIIAIAGAGVSSLGYGALLIAAGVPVFYFFRSASAERAT
ncbi:MAG: amino acid permease [Pseudomonadota bacterium]